MLRMLEVLSQHPLDDRPDHLRSNLLPLFWSMDSSFWVKHTSSKRKETLFSLSRNVTNFPFERNIWRANIVRHKNARNLLSVGLVKLPLT